MGRRRTTKNRSFARSDRSPEDLDQLPRPWNPEALFGRAAAGGPSHFSSPGSENGTVPFVAGRYARSRWKSDRARDCFCETSAAKTEVNFLGIEVACKYAHFAAAGLAKAGLRNAIMVHGDGLRILPRVHSRRFVGRRACVFSRSVVEESAPAAAGDAGIVPPRRRANVAARRIAAFLDRRGGVFPDSLELLAAHTPLLGPLPVPETPAEHDMAYRTHFERRVQIGQRAGLSVGVQKK